MNKTLSPILIVALIFSLTANYLFYIHYSNSRSLFTVGSETIRKKDLNDRVDGLYATDILRKLIWVSMIDQEAKKRHCQATVAQVNDALSEMERLKPSVIASVKAIDPKLAWFREDLRNNIDLRNVQISGITVTKTEVEKYYKTHKSDFRSAARIETIMAIAQSPGVCDSAVHLLENGVGSRVLAERPGLNVIADPLAFAKNIPNDTAEQIALQKDSTVRAYRYATGFLIVKINGISPASTPPLSEIYSNVETAAKLAKAPSQEEVLRDVRRRTSIVCDSANYAGAVPPLQ